MSYKKRGRKSYSGLMQQKVWGAYNKQGVLQGTCKAESQEAAWGVFDTHNKRNPKFPIHGEIREIK